MINEELKKIIDSEPDLAVFKKSKDIVIVLARRPNLGFWRGYVAVSPTAPESYVRAVDDCDIDYDVHGGVTYRGLHKEFDPQYGGWLFIGFDCGHAGDMIGNPTLPGLCFENETYKTYDYALSEANKLYDQVVAKTAEDSVATALTNNKGGQHGQANKDSFTNHSNFNSKHG